MQQLAYAKKRASGMARRALTPPFVASARKSSQAVWATVRELGAHMTWQRMAKYMDANGHGAAFARAFLLDPVMTGALAPSSHRLAVAVVAPLRVRPETFVVEIGCGTGALTEAVFALGLQDKQYLGIELSPVMVSALTARFPSASFLRGSAEHLVRALRERGRSGASHVVCSLPWTLLTSEERNKILRAISAVLEPGGQLLSFSYVPGCILPAWRQFAGNVCEAFSNVSLGKLVWRNLPPAFTWRASNA